MILIANNKYTLYADNTLTVKNHNIANRVNKYLNYYKDYTFRAKVKDEPQFKFKAEQLNDIKKLLKGTL